MMRYHPQPQSMFAPSSLPKIIYSRCHVKPTLFCYWDVLVPDPGLALLQRQRWWQQWSGPGSGSGLTQALTELKVSGRQQYNHGFLWRMTMFDSFFLSLLGGTGKLDLLSRGQFSMPINIPHSLTGVKHEVAIWRLRS